MVVTLYVTARLNRENCCIEFDLNILLRVQKLHSGQSARITLTPGCKFCIQARLQELHLGLREKFALGPARMQNLHAD